MADSRIKDLAAEVIVGDLSALLNTLYLAVDDTSFSDAKKVLLKTILTESIVSANTNNYQAMTPKAFYDSVMTTTRMGIGQLSKDANVTSKTGTGLLNSVHQVLMQAQWYKDWFVANGIPSVVYKDLSTNENCQSFQVNASIELAQYATWKINPTLPAGKRIHGFVYNVVIDHADYLQVYGQTGRVRYTGAVNYEWIESAALGIYLSADGLTLGMVSNVPTTDLVTLSGTFNCILKDI